MRVVSVGHVLFALTMIGLGVAGLIKGDFTPLWPPVPKGYPAHAVLVYLCAFIPLVCGAGLLVKRYAALASRVLLGFFIAWLLLIRVPHIVIAPGIGTYWAACQTGVMVAASCVLFFRFTRGTGEARVALDPGDARVRITRVIYGIAMIEFGLAHFLYMGNTAPLVPAYLPYHVAWGYFTGAAFVAAGLASITGVMARLATTLSAWQMGLFTLLVWVPIVMGTPKPSDWSEFIVSWVLTTAAWVMAESYGTRRQSVGAG